jgi:hypothetical protein
MTTQEERIDRLWEIIELSIAANYDMLERLCMYEPDLRGQLWEFARMNRLIAQKCRYMLEDEGIDVDKALAERRARLEANPFGFDVVEDEDRA